MPTYEYECAKCGTIFDHFQSIKAPKLTHCTEEGCRGKVTRLLALVEGLSLRAAVFTKQITAVKTTRAAKRKPATPPRKLRRKNRKAKNLIPKRKVARKVSPKNMTLSFASRTLRCLAALALLSTVDWAHAQRLRPGQTLTSRSRQFVVSSLVDATFVAAPNKVKAVPDRVQLHPSGLAQFAESIRDQWVKRFGIASRWQGQIHLQIIPGKLGDPSRLAASPMPPALGITGPPCLNLCPA